MMPDARSPAPCAARHVFVYGTLRRGGSNDIARYRPPPVLVGVAAVAGTLFDLGPYPGAVLGGNGLVHGEVYRITREVEAALDVLEGVADDGSGEYAKREIQVDAVGAMLACLVYEIDLARIDGRRTIASGDWMKR